MFDWIQAIFGLGGKVIDIADQVVIDKDKVIALAAEGKHDELALYIAELSTRTIPIVDALHKMGRQIQTYMIIGLAFYCAKTGKPLPDVAWLVTGGAVGVYSMMKGRGQ